MYHAVQGKSWWIFQPAMFKDTKVGYLGVFERGGYPKY